jgi:hypothetical protein
MKIKTRRERFGLEMRTVRGKAGRYPVSQTRNGALRVNS